MKPVCCDTSFLYSAYAADAHTPRALRQMESLKTPLTLSILNVLELENALRSASFRRLLALAHMRVAMASFETDCREKRIIIASIDLAKVVAEARRLSAAHTVSGGHRAFDILVVAAALCLGAKEFWSFDVKQRKLAVAEGLQINP